MKHNKSLIIGLLGLALLLSSLPPRVKTVQAATEPIPNAPIKVAQV